MRPSCGCGRRHVDSPGNGESLKFGFFSRSTHTTIIGLSNKIYNIISRFWREIVLLRADKFPSRATCVQHWESFFNLDFFCMVHNAAHQTNVLQYFPILEKNCAALMG